jgi:hypothetical protein
LDSRIGELVDTIHRLEVELELELAKRRTELAFAVRGRVVQFEETILRRHRQLKTGLASYLLGSRPLLVLTAPVIYAPLAAFLLLDGLVTAYQWICFPIYGIARVSRHDYLIFDRYHLAYLNLIERVNCVYCSYANGLIAYVREIASRTEQYWCPIKHARRVIAAHERYPRFADYGDAESYQKELARLREELRESRVSS